MARLLIASLIVFNAGCQLVTCDDICDGHAGGAGGSSGGSAGGTAGGVSGGGGSATAGGATAGGSGGGDAGGAAGGDAGGMAGGDAGGMAGGDAGGGTAGGAAGGVHTSVVFVTEATFHGNFSSQAPGYNGADAADRLCNVAAMNASLPGTFKAWVSGFGGMNPSNHLNDSSPWKLNGTTLTVFSSKSALAASPGAPINRNERGFLVTGTTDVWSGATGAFVGGVNCTAWSTNLMSVTGVKGSTSSTTQWMNTGTPQTCNLPARLYCFEQQ